MKKILPTIVLGSLLTVLLVPVVASAAEAEMPATCSVDIAKTKLTTDCGNTATGATDGTCDPSAETTGGACGMCCTLNTIYKATNWLFYILTLIAVIMIIVGGFVYMTASGDPEKAGKGKTFIVYALIGLAVALFSKVFPSIVRFIMGV